MNDKLTVIGSKFYQQCEVIMLPTEKASLLFMNNIQKGLFLVGGKGILAKHRIGNSTNQHLYILSDEEIKEGDWILTKKYNNPVKANKFIKSIGWYYSNTLVNDICSGKKIIATTDESLEIPCKVKCHDCNGKGEQIMPYKDNGEVCSRCSGTGLEDNEKPFLRPSNDFIKAFIEKQGKIDKVLVEYVDWCDYDDDNEIGLDKPDLRLKVAPDNTITIKPIQEEKASWSRDEVITYGKLAFEVGRNYQLTGENNLSEIEENL